MINMIQNAKDQVATLAMNAYQAAVADGHSEVRAEREEHYAPEKVHRKLREVNPERAPAANVVYVG